MDPVEKKKLKFFGTNDQRVVYKLSSHILLGSSYSIHSAFSP